MIPKTAIINIKGLTDAFGLLSSMYLCNPSKMSIASWKSALSKNAVPLSRIKKALNKIDETSEDQLEKLLWEYTRLFIGPYKLPCPPWESVYTSPKKLLMQEPAQQVAKMYADAGLQINTRDVLPDHVGIELNFLSVLLRRIGEESDKREYYTELADRFISEHLLNWVPAFADDLGDASDSLFYRALASSTKNLIDFVA